MKIQRSWLFVPGDNEKMINKTKELNVDVFIFDLEDSVLQENKKKARKIIKQFLKQGDSNDHYYIRINKNDKYNLKDITESFNGKIRGIILPKIEEPQEIIDIENTLLTLEVEYQLKNNTIKIIPLIETALGVHHAFNIATSSRRIECLAFGSIDYLLDINGGVTETRHETLYARSQLVLASRIAKIGAPIDTVFPYINDSAGLKSETKYIKKLGFQGKLIIHPNQIDVVNKIFTPTSEEIERAQEIMGMIGSNAIYGKGAYAVSGEMIDRPVIEKYSSILKQAEQLKMI